MVFIKYYTIILFWGPGTCIYIYYRVVYPFTNSNQQNKMYPFDYEKYTVFQL